MFPILGHLGRFLAVTCPLLTSAIAGAQPYPGEGALIPGEPFRAGESMHNCNDPGNLLTNCGFETGDFAGWVVTDLPGPFIQVQVGAAGLNPRSRPFDISFEPQGTTGYDDLQRQVVTYDLVGVVVPTASLADVIRSKEAADREKDRQQLPTLRVLQEEFERRNS